MQKAYLVVLSVHSSSASASSQLPLKKKSSSLTSKASMSLAVSAMITVQTYFGYWLLRSNEVHNIKEENCTIIAFT